MAIMADENLVYETLWLWLSRMISKYVSGIFKTWENFLSDYGRKKYFQVKSVCTKSESKGRTSIFYQEFTQYLAFVVTFFHLTLWTAGLKGKEHQSSPSDAWSHCTTASFGFTWNQLLNKFIHHGPASSEISQMSFRMEVSASENCK